MLLHALIANQVTSNRKMVLLAAIAVLLGPSVRMQLLFPVICALPANFNPLMVAQAALTVTQESPHRVAPLVAITVMQAAILLVQVHPRVIHV